MNSKALNDLVNTNSNNNENSLVVIDNIDKEVMKEVNNDEHQKWFLGKPTNVTDCKTENENFTKKVYYGVDVNIKLM